MVVFSNLFEAKCTLGAIERSLYLVILFIGQMHIHVMVPAIKATEVISPLYKVFYFQTLNGALGWGGSESHKMICA